MKTHQERDNALKVIQQKGNKQESAFKDGRSETVMQSNLYNMVNNSGRVTQLQSLQRIADNRVQNNAFSPVQRKENNTGLPDNLKSGIENLSGYSMDDVNVHYNSPKPAQLQAHAYAQGTDIHLGAGQEKYLPHEAWHVVQQKQGRVKPTIQMKGKVNVNDDSGLEREADVMGAKALSSNVPVESKINNHSETVVQNKLYNSVNNNEKVAQLEKSRLNDLFDDLRGIGPGAAARREERERQEKAEKEIEQQPQREKEEIERQQQREKEQQKQREKEEIERRRKEETDLLVVKDIRANSRLKVVN